MAMNKQTFLATRRPLTRSEPIQLPGRDEPIYVRELNGLEAATLENRRYPVARDGTKRLDIGNENINWVLACLCDDAGVLLLEEADRPAVGVLPDPDLARIAAEAQRINLPSRDPVMDAAKN